MSVNRREFLGFAGVGLAASAVAPATAWSGMSGNVKAVAFDAFPVFDPRPIFTLTEELFPGQGAELSRAWRTRQFEYQWLRALAGRYADFWRATEEALIYSARALRLDLTTATRTRLMEAYLALDVWPDVPAALPLLSRAGLRLAFLSNATPQILDSAIRRAELADLFEAVISTDSIRSYKPDPRAYQLAVDTLRLRRDQILFVAFAGWDVAGAKWFGYPTFWVNRLGLPEGELGIVPDGTGPGLQDLVTFVGAR